MSVIYPYVTNGVNMSKAPTKVKKVLKEFKEGKLHSGSKTGPKVKSRKQAVAIGLSEAREKGEKVAAKKPVATAVKKAKMQQEAYKAKGKK